MSDELVVFFKALADGSRMKIIGLLARQPYSVEELAALLGLKPSTVSHHLSRLAEAGLVSARAEGYYSMYQLEEAALQRMRRLFSRADLALAASGVDGEAYDRKIVAEFTRPDGGLKSLPAQRKKRAAILRHVVQAFAVGQRYPEKRVNEILAHYHPDTATLRRELVAEHLLQRQGGGGEYWRPEPVDE